MIVVNAHVFLGARDRPQGTPPDLFPADSAAASARGPAPDPLAFWYPPTQVMQYIDPLVFLNLCGIAFPQGDPAPPDQWRI